MQRPNHAAIFVVGASFAVVAAVVGTTAALDVGGDRDATQAASVDTHNQPEHAVRQLEQAVPGSTASQIPDTSVVAGNEALHTRPGVLVARGHQFVIETVPLSRPTTVALHGRTFVAHSVYRITISAGPYEVRDMPDVVSVDGRPLAVGMESPDLSSLIAFTFDSSVLKQGAMLRVSYGLPNATDTIWKAAIEVVK